jgi:hypothetical protein
MAVIAHYFLHLGNMLILNAYQKRHVSFPEEPAGAVDLSGAISSLGEGGKKWFGIGALNHRDDKLHDLIPFAPGCPRRRAGIESVATYYAIASH